MVLLSIMKYQISNPFRYKIKSWDPPPTLYNKESSLEEIKRAFSKNKVVPKDLEDLFYETIAHYPELKETYLFIKETKFYGVQHTLRAYPPLLSLPNKKEDRVYPIVININKNVPIPFYSLTQEQQKGILAHEMAHIADYTKRTSLQIIGLLLNLVISKKFVKKFENSTDQTAIKRGLGNSLSEFRRHVIKENSSYGFYQGVIYKDAPILGWKSFSFNIKYSILNVWSFFPAITEMMVLVYIKKIHKRR